MNISFDRKKREATLADRGLDFRDAAEVFEGITFDYEAPVSTIPRSG
jgi:uncharacterized DUF497 family protein